MSNTDQKIGQKRGQDTKLPGNDTEDPGKDTELPGSNFPGNPGI